MKEKSLRDKTVSGLSWSFLDKILQNAFVFVSGILLAKQIGKDNFGLIGTLAIFLGLANILQESGFTSALIRKKDVTQTDYTTVFYTNISIGITLYLLFFFSFPLISDFLIKDPSDKPILIDVSRVYFLSFLFNSFSVIQNARIIKEINYKLLAKINLFSILTSYIIALTLAYLNYGVWALAMQVVSLTFFKMCCFWIFGKWKPSGKFCKKSFNELFSFSSKLLLGSAVNAITANLPQSVLSKFYTLGVGGLYNQAYRNYVSAYELLNGSVYNVSYPVLSSVHDEVKLKSVFRRFIRIKALISFPVFMGIILVAESFMHILGEQWLPAAPILQLLAVCGIFTGLETANGDILRIKGKSGTILYLTIMQAILILLAIAIPLTFGLHYLYYVAGISATYIIRYIVSSFISTKLISYRIAELGKDLLPYFAIALACVACGYLLSFLISNPIVLMVCQIVFVGVLYFGSLYITGSKILKDAIEYITKKGG